MDNFFATQPCKRTLQDIIAEKSKKIATDPLMMYALISHLKNLLSMPCNVTDKVTPELKYRRRIVEMFIDNIDSLHQTEAIPLDVMKDCTSLFLLGEMWINHNLKSKYSRVLRSKTFYMYACVGDVLDLKVDEITDSNYELLIVHKHSLDFKLDDLNLTAILPKTGTTIALAKNDYIRAAVIDFDKRNLQLIVSLDAFVMEDQKQIKLGKLKTIDTVCNKVSTNHKYYSHYLKTVSPMIFNKSEWQEEMESLGINPFITGETNEQPNRSNQEPSLKLFPETIHDVKKKLQVNPSDEPSKKHMAKLLYKSAKKYDMKGDIDKAILNLKAAKLLWHSFPLAISKKKFSKRLLKAWSKL